MGQEPDHVPDVAVSKMLRQPKLRCIIAVPQTTIGRNFTESWKLPVPGCKKRADWMIQHNLCHSGYRTVREFFRFLRQRPFDGPTFADRVLLCTHATLALAYRRSEA